ncbi:MAG: hypothetical protein ACK55I_33440, partial [bacterium]
MRFRYTQLPTAQIGQSFALPIGVAYNAAEFNGAQPTNFTLTITHDPEAIKFNSFAATQMAGWTFTPTASAGRLDIAAVTVG